VRKKRKKEKKNRIRPRVFVVLGFFLLAFSLIFMRAFQLQVIEGDALRKMASRQHVRTVSLKSKRGAIYDRNLKALAISIDVDSIYAQPTKIRSPRAVARALAPITSMSDSAIERKIRRGRGFVWLKRQIDLDEAAREKIAAIKGVGIIKESRRYYPNRTLASNLIGFTGVDSNGLEGIEHSYNRFLVGTARRISGGRDARGRLILYGDTDNVVPIEGMSVELTIDKTIQYVTESALKRAIDKSGAKGGIAVVMSPATGEVLAMANQPGFDPNDFGRASPALWRNRAVTDTFEPGSLIKVFLVAGALEENVVTTGDIFYCENGKFRVADRVFHDAEKNGWLSVANIIKFSSNIGALKIADKMGRERVYRTLRGFGFGRRTGIDLPGDTPGVLPAPDKWSGVTLHTLAFGQGLSVSSIQLASALGAIANGGFLMRPYIVREVRDSGGSVVKSNNPAIIRRAISAETAKTIRRLMVRVTEPGGTGTKAALAGFEVAGKTGTAQKPDFKKGGYKRGAYVSSFFGFLPAKDPELVITVTLDEPQKGYYGGDVAAPAFREIASKSLSYLGVTPSGSAGVRPLMARSARHASRGAKKALARNVTRKVREGYVADFRGLTVRKALRVSMEDSIKIEMIGGGVAVRQSPRPGRPLKGEKVVRVWFQ